MRTYLKNNLHSSYLSSVAVLMSGSLVAQIIAFAVAPLMTRLYSEAAIGEYTLILTVVSMFGPVVCGRYDMSIVSEPNLDKTFAIIKLCFICSLLTSFVCAIFYTLYTYNSGGTEISFIVFLSCSFFLLLFTGIGNIGSAYNNKEQNYKLLSKISIFREVGRDIVLITLGLIRLGTWGLILSQFASILLCLKEQFQSLKDYLIKILLIPNSRVIEVAKKYKNQPLFSLPALFLNNFSYSALNIIVAKLFGLEILAYYSMSFRILGLPISLLSTNVSKVYFERASSYYSLGKSFAFLLIKTALLLFILSAPIMLFLFLFSPNIFAFLFGENWKISGDMVVCLIPMFSIKLIVGTLTPTLIVVNKQIIDMIMQFMFLLGTAVSFIYCKGCDNVFVFIKLINWIYFFIYLAYFFIMLLYSSKNK